MHLCGAQARYLWGLQISARNTPGKSPTQSVVNIATPELAPSTPILQEEDAPVTQPSDDVSMEDAEAIEPCVFVPFVHLPKLIQLPTPVTAEDVSDASPPANISIAADDDKGEFFWIHVVA